MPSVYAVNGYDVARFHTLLDVALQRAERPFISDSSAPMETR